jgi:glycosyltransferase involved in cell wall biosynthesis
MRLSYRFSNGLIAVSEGVKQDMCSLSGMKPSKIRVIYNPAAKGIEIDDSLRVDPAGLWKGHTGFKILSVGTLKTQKDHETLLRALALLPAALDVRLVILGEGPLREDLTRLAEEIGVTDRVSMPGFVLDPYPWFSSADLFVLSSRWEGFGNVIVEALECGTPVVSTDCVSGPSEILDNGRYGELVPVQDPVRLARAIEVSLIKKHDRLTLRHRAKEFSVENISKKYIDYFFHD